MKKTESMKTGRDANQPGLYTSECCLVEINVTKGQMLPRCPACYALTVWELGERATSKIDTQPAAEPYKGLGFRNVEARVRAGQYDIEEFAVLKG
jgi:hypothetical protein